MTKRFISLVLAALMAIISCGGLTHVTLADGAENTLKKTAVLNEQAKGGHADDDDVRIIVQLADAPALAGQVSVKSARSCQKKLCAEQVKAMAKIENAIGGELTNVEQFSLLFNGISFDGKTSDIDAVNGIDGMRAFVSPTYTLPSPDMMTGAEKVGAVSAWDFDYTGKGMTIAIIDTGIRSTHDAFSVAPDGAKYDVEALARKIADAEDYLHAGNDAEQLFVSPKIPFGYDYQYESYSTAHVSSDHGTHVAGIAAGNNGGDFRGIAYDAQLFVMQVFEDDGNAEWDTILRALEDCAYLGVDSVNMSLGSSCGSCTYSDEVFEAAFSLLSRTGILVAAASGNDGTQAQYNRWGGYQLAENPDSGLTSSPATFYPCLSVASVNNTAVSGGIISAYGRDIKYDEPQSGAPSFATLAGKHTYRFCGLGADDDMPSDLGGSIALIKRGDLTFTEKAHNAQAHGASAVIVYNSQPGSFSSISVSSEIPFVTLSDTDGEFLLSRMSENAGTLEIPFSDAVSGLENISSFSSRGTTADLKIKPEISAPGGGVYSCIGFGSDSSYASWNGTSMATPFVAGGMVIVKQYAEEMFPHSTAEEIAEITDNILMGTAQTLNGELVTAQGAGLMDLESALKTGTYITAGGSRPKVELDESEEGTWDFEIEVTDFSDKPVTYSVSHKYMIQDTTEKAYEESYLTFTTGTPCDVTSLVKTAGESEVTVEPGQTVTLHFSLDARDVQKVYGEKFPVGMLLEGFITLKNADEELSVPVLGFIGDWDRQSMFDRGFYWQELTGELNLNSNGHIASNAAITDRDYQPSYVGYNPFMPMSDTFNPDWGAISPNDDGNCDSVSILRFGMLRNSKTLTIDVVTPGETICIYEAEKYDFAKDFYVSGSGYSYTEYPLNYIGQGLSEGETAYITVNAELDHEGFDPENNECAQWTIPVTLDTTAPTVYMDGGRVTVYDEHYIAFSAVYADASLHTAVGSPVSYFDTERGTSHVCSREGRYYLYVGDYAGNTAVYNVDTDAGVVTNTDDALHTLVFKTDDKVYRAIRLHEGDPVNAPSAPEKEGHIFDGWDSEIPETMPDHDIVINAVFIKNSYTVVFTDYDGTVLSEQDVEYGEAAQAPDVPDREGYVFTGWDKDFSSVSEDLIITAQYERIMHRVVFYDMNAYTVIDEQTVAHGEAALAPQPPEHDGYIFDGWDCDFSCVTEDMEVYALYRKDILIGDVNFDGTVNTADAVVVLKYSAEMLILDCTGFKAADVNCNDIVNTQDAVIILKYAAGMITELGK